MAKLPPEPALEPDLPIVDPHHHLWLETPADTASRQGDENPFNHVRREIPRYLFDELHEDLTKGHNVIATVYAECGSMYRAMTTRLKKTMMQGRITAAAMRPPSTSAIFPPRARETWACARARSEALRPRPRTRSGRRSHR